MSDADEQEVIDRVLKLTGAKVEAAKLVLLDGIHRQIKQQSIVLIMIQVQLVALTIVVLSK